VSQEKVDELCLKSWRLREKNNLHSILVAVPGLIGFIVMVLFLLGKIPQGWGIVGAGLLVWALIESFIVEGIEHEMGSIDNQIREAEASGGLASMWHSPRDPGPSKRDREAKQKAKVAAKAEARRAERLAAGKDN